MSGSMDAIDELVIRSTDHPELRIFHEFHRQNPHVLDFLVSEIRRRISAGFPAFSFNSLWHYCRWKLEAHSGPSATFMMNDHLTPWYSRAILILHPDLNGRAETRRCIADEVFGLCHEQIQKPKSYARRLVWVDGTPLGHGWRPSIPHIVAARPTVKPDIHPR